QMQPGQLSLPMRTSQGYVIIAYIERKLPESDGQILLTLQQVLIPFPKDVTEEKAREIMVKAEEISRKAKSCPDFEKASKDIFPSASSRLSHNESLLNFPDPLQEVILPLAVNKSSEPLLTEEGALLVMVCDKKSQKKEELSK